MTDQKKKILIVVDVQNCFIQGGSLGSLKPEDIEKHIEMTKRIARLVENGGYDLVVFSRDLHPKNHASLYKDDTGKNDPVHGVYIPHCRDETRDCENQYNQYTEPPIKNDPLNLTTIEELRKQNTTINEFLKKNDSNFDFYSNKRFFVKGKQLSYLFYGTQLANTIKKLNQEPELYNIGLKPNAEYKGKPDINQIKYPKNPLQTIGKSKCITITKGQFCNYESYSAFNYHLEIKVTDKDKNKNVLEDIKTPEKEKSTGLFEYLIQNNYISDNTEIDVCGLVTNICVINTVQQGLAMWNHIYKIENQNKNIQFRLLEYASLPLKVEENIDFLNYPYDSPIIDITGKQNEEQINKLVELFKAKGIHDLQINDFHIEILKTPIKDNEKGDENDNFVVINPMNNTQNNNEYAFEIIINEEDMKLEKKSTNKFFGMNLFGSKYNNNTKTQTGGHTKRCVCPGCLSKRRCTKKKRKNLHKTRKTSPKKYRKEKRLSKKIR